MLDSRSFAASRQAAAALLGEYAVWLAVVDRSAADFDALIEQKVEEQVAALAADPTLDIDVVLSELNSALIALRSDPARTRLAHEGRAQPARIRSRARARERRDRGARSRGISTARGGDSGDDSDDSDEPPARLSPGLFVVPHGAPPGANNEVRPRGGGGARRTPR